MHALIEADGLTKSFGKVQALAELTLTLPSGQPVAIMGFVVRDGRVAAIDVLANPARLARIDLSAVTG